MPLHIAERQKNRLGALACMLGVTLAGLAVTSAAAPAAHGQDTGLPGQGRQSAEPLVEPADMILWDGIIHTADDNNPTAEAVAVRAGRIVHVGSRAGAEALRGTDTQVIPLSGHALYPGFVDAHAHLVGIGEREMSLSLENTPSLAVLLERLKQWAATHDDAVLTGLGWIETHWPENRFPSRFDLDTVVSDRPVILTRADGHALVANTAAFKAAGITAATESPEGGRIERNALGEATGMLIDTAMSLLQPLIPTADDARLADMLTTGARVYGQQGWTGLHNMSVPWRQVELIETLSDTGAIDIRIYNAVTQDSADRLFAAGHRTSENGRAETRAIKLYMDGALGSRGAALLSNYADADTDGLLLLQWQAAEPIMRRALTEGIQLAIHAIGDRGNRLALDWIERSLADVPADGRAIADPRWRIEHAQIIAREDLGRFAASRLIASMQPSHAISDLFFAGDRLGDDRLDGAYAWASMVDAGVIVAAGSDAPVERGSPLIEFYAAVTRRDLKGFQGPDWRPGEAVSRDTALKMLTLWPAYAAFAETDRGSVTVGKVADFTVFDRDLMSVADNAILDARAILTIVDGRIVHRAAGF
ncbi:amidohydrolase [Eilatimonas milleporae]|uniref:Amidohydrolase 3 domain-containing protein n=1 Tax=Eilatimonas milleporae TaxID=911205 RepID=A0A3M0C1R1_9PROT|nr:amidohydrolase [Eilatimonas milleporae]RMB02815.1 hypothetical protein BXY39_3167 [Eilatimonas milleporae]